MLNGKQLARHWRIWGDVCARNHWSMLKGRLDPQARASGTVTDAHVQTWNHAAAHAELKRRATTVEDLRKGAYAVALGGFRSLTTFGNPQFDRVLTVFRVLLIGAEFRTGDLGAMMDWTAYVEFDRVTRENAARIRAGQPRQPLPNDPGERKRHIWYLSTLATEYVAAVARDKFGHVEGHWYQDLELLELRQLVMTLKNRPASELNQNLLQKVTKETKVTEADEAEAARMEMATVEEPF